MANDLQIDINISALVDDLERLSKAARGQVLMKSAMAGGLVVEGAAKMFIIDYDFIDTGATLNSTQAREGDLSDWRAEVEVGPTTEYAIYGELGMGGQSEKPFMRRALNETQGQVINIVADELREQIKKAIK